MKFLNQCGRSMIEMLGVLAIIGVLSVGGLVGYNKAMYKTRLNKQIEEYNFLFAYLSTHYDAFRDMTANKDTEIHVVPILLKLGIIPNDPQRIISSYSYQDHFGHRFFIRYYSAFDFNLVLSDSATSFGIKQYCMDLLTGLFQPNHDIFKYVSLLKGIGGSEEQPASSPFSYYGDQYCIGSRKCLVQLTLEQADQFCTACEEEKMCRISVSIP